MSEILGYADIVACIPERPPLVMVDRMEIADDACHATGVKNVTIGEAFFEGHFPGAPILPGVLQVAAMTQVAAVLLQKREGQAMCGVPWLKALRRVKFRKPVHPGDQLTIEVELDAERSEDGQQVKARVSVGDAVVSQGTIVLDTVDPDQFFRPSGELARAQLAAADDEGAGGFDTLQVMGAIPHRFPFQLLDRALRVDHEADVAVGVKNVTGNEALLAGMAVPTFPGYLQAEAAAQAACVVALTTPGNEDKLGYFMSIDDAVFHAPVLPGDQLVMTMELRGRGRFGVAEGTLAVGGRTVTDVVLKFAIVDRE